MYEKKRYERTCAYCGAPFVAHNKQKIYCSKRCKDVSLRVKKGIKCNPNTEPYHKVCAVCGKAYDTFRETSVTCSPECSQEHRLIRQKRICHQKTTVNKITAEQCVKERHGDRFEYIRQSKGRIQMRCKTCGKIVERARSTLKYKNIVCEHCKEEKLKVEARQKMMRFLIALKESKTPKICESCGKVFYSANPSQVHCTKNCKKSRQTSVRRRCKKHGVYYDSSVTRIKVAKRDHYVCQICGKVCDPNDKRWGAFGPDYPTLDHIIPLARGGAHTWDNVQCACAICNSEKRDLIGDLYGSTERYCGQEIKARPVEDIA